MVELLKIALIISLFMVSKGVISKMLGKRARMTILGKVDRSSKYKIESKVIKNITVFAISFFIALVAGYNIGFSIIFGMLFACLVYITKFIKQSFIKKQVFCDLLNVSECMRVQISSCIPLENTLRTVSQLCVNKELAALLTNIYLEYELSKFVITDAGESLINRFSYPETRIFVSALNQQIQGTSAIEAFDNLILILKERYIEYLEDSTKNKMTIMTMGVFIIVINIATIGIYPMIIEIFDAMNMILK